MFGAEYVLAFIGVFFKIGFAIVTALPFRIVWNSIIPIYFRDYVPTQFQNIPYWHFVGILLLISFIGDVIQSLTPKIVKVEQTVKTD